MSKRDQEIMNDFDELLKENLELKERIRQLEAENESLIRECQQMAHIITTFDNPDPAN